MKLFLLDGSRLAFKRSDGNFGLVARLVGGEWEKLIVPGGVVHRDEVGVVEEMRVFIPSVMDSPPWREEERVHSEE